MDIMELGAIGELVGGVAVIGSLLYVGLQVLQGNSIERARANREVTREGNLIYMELREPEFMPTLGRASVDFESLSNDDKSLVTYRSLGPIVAHATATFLASRDRRADLNYADAWLFTLAAIARSPGFGQWGHQVKRALEPDFVDEVDRLCSAADAPLASHELMPWLVPSEDESEGR